MASEELKQKMQLQLHEQYAINNNAHIGSLVAFIGAVVTIFIGYGIVYHSTPSSCCCNCSHVIHSAISSIYSISELYWITIVAVGLLCFLACLCVVIGYGQRRDQIVIQKFRKDVGLQLYADATNKCLYNYLIGYYMAFWWLFWLFEILLFVAILDKTCPCHINGYFRFITIISALILLPWIVLLYHYHKYKKIKCKGMNMKAQTIDNNLILTFLKDAYFSEWRTEAGAYVAAGNRAYRDFCRTIRGMKEHNGEKDNLKNEISTAIFVSLNESNPQSQESFDTWHHQICEEIIEKYRGAAPLHYGQAQKWVNMALKYGIVLEIPQAVAAIPYAHVPVDNIVLGMLIGKVEPVTNDAWSRWDYKTYITFQNALRDYLKDEYPIVWEFTNWK